MTIYYRVYVDTFEDNYVHDGFTTSIADAGKTLATWNTTIEQSFDEYTLKYGTKGFKFRIEQVSADVVIQSALETMGTDDLNPLPRLT